MDKKGHVSDKSQEKSSSQSQNKSHESYNDKSQKAHGSGSSEQSWKCNPNDHEPYGYRAPQTKLTRKENECANIKFKDFRDPK